ncbi:MAG: hypothetical protein GX284_07525 [Clostridiales bacterium]|nr:hypothetical protein [Clostridiales bacterium]
MDIMILGLEDGNSLFFLDYVIEKNEAFLHNDGITYQVYCEGLAEKLHSGVGENHGLPALYSCEHGAVTNASFSKFSVPVAILNHEKYVIIDPKCEFRKE